MTRDISIAFKASDSLTYSIMQMRKSVDGLKKDVLGYRKIQDEAFGKRAEISFNIDKAKKELKELEKAEKEGKEVTKEAILEKIKDIELLNEEYKRLGKNARDAKKEEDKLQEGVTKRSNKIAARNSSSVVDSLSNSSIMKSLAGAGIVNMLGNSMSGLFDQSISSMYGERVGNAVGSITGGIASGAAIGSIAGPIGTAVGAAVGGLTGAINALTESKKIEDDAFKQEVQSVFAMVKQEQEQGVEKGTEFTSLREQNTKALTTLLGSKETGAKLFDEIRKFGIDTPYEATSMLNSAKQMLAYGVEEKNIMTDMKMLGEVAMGDQNKFNGLSYVYAQTQSAGKLNGQDLRQYTEAGFNPLKVLAEATGQSLEDMRDLMSDGLITAEDVTLAFKIATSEGGQFFGAMKDQMDTYSGRLSMLKDIKSEIEGGYGEGYTETRKRGMELEIAQLNGTVGEKMKEANSLIGEFKADLENKYQQSIITATQNAMESDDYLKAQQENNGAEMGRILAEARAKAEAEYKNTEAYKLQLETDLNLVKNIQNNMDICQEYFNYGVKMANEFSKGWSSVAEKNKYKNDIDKTLNNQETDMWMNTYYSHDLNSEKENENGEATGLNIVPRDGIFKLHEGERVLSRVETSKYDRLMNDINEKKLENGYATGLARVPKDGLFKLHEGERVLSRVDASKHDKVLNSKNSYEVTKKSELINNETQNKPTMNFYITGSNKEDIINEVIITLTNILENSGEVG